MADQLGETAREALIFPRDENARLGQNRSTCLWHATHACT